MAQGENVRGGQEAGAADRAAVVLDLDEGVVFVGDGDVVDVNEAVGTAGEETSWLGGVESHFCDVVVVAFDVVLQRSAWGAHVPVTVMSSFVIWVRVRGGFGTREPRQLENGSTLYPQQCLCREKPETSMELYCLGSSSTPTSVAADVRRLLTVAQLHGLLPKSHVVSLHHSIPPCCQQTAGIMVHGLQAGHAIMHVGYGSAGDFPQGLKIDQTERVVGRDCCKIAVDM